MRKRAEEELAHYHSHLEHLVRERTHELRELAHRLVDAQEKERAEIGISLHDEIGQLLTYTTLLIDKAARKPDAERLQEAKGIVQEAISKIRDLSSMLSPRLLRSAGLAQAASSLIEEFSRRTTLPVDFDCNEGLDKISEEAALACYRIIQESLTNILRYANATRVKVRLMHDSNEVRLEVNDDGIGFDPQKMKRTTGITGMRERALALGGEFKINSAPGRGTHVIAVIPFTERKQA
jgi:signal transduction histidine kinase